MPSPIRVVAPSGVATLNISGRTIHSAFSLPINNVNEFVRLAGSRLANHQLLWEGVQFVIFDEKSMIGARTLVSLHKLIGALVNSVPEQLTNLSQI